MTPKKNKQKRFLFVRFPAGLLILSLILGPNSAGVHAGPGPGTLRVSQPEDPSRRLALRAGLEEKLGWVPWLATFGAWMRTNQALSGFSGDRARARREINQLAVKWTREKRSPRFILKWILPAVIRGSHSPEELTANLQFFDLFLSRWYKRYQSAGCLPTPPDNMSPDRFIPGLRWVDRMALIQVDPYLNLTYGVPAVSRTCSTQQDFLKGLDSLGDFLKRLKEMNSESDGMALSYGVETVAEQSSTLQTFQENLAHLEELFRRLQDPAQGSQWSKSAFAMALPQLALEAIELRRMGADYKVEWVGSPEKGWAAVLTWEGSLQPLAPTMREAIISALDHPGNTPLSLPKGIPPPARRLLEQRLDQEWPAPLREPPHFSDGNGVARPLGDGVRNAIDRVIDQNGVAEVYRIGQGEILLPDPLVLGPDPAKWQWGRRFPAAPGEVFLVGTYLNGDLRPQRWFLVRVGESGISVLENGFRLNDNDGKIGLEKVRVTAAWPSAPPAGTDGAISVKPFTFVQRPGALEVRMDLGNSSQPILLYSLVRFGDFGKLPARLDFNAEVLTPNQFLLRYAPSLPSQEGPNGQQVKEWLQRPGSQATVVELPRHPTLYVHTSHLYDVVSKTIHEPMGCFWNIIPLPETEEEWRRFRWERLGLILKNALVPESSFKNPNQLPEVVVDSPSEEAIMRLDPEQLLARMFQSRLGITDSEYLGAWVFTKEGRTELVLFSSA